ncbi:GYD domain-containing protein [Bradyrhizobium archetypum]|nr:GYD domain-containing protein [Bradyrhizobium archetypum]
MDLDAINAFCIAQRIVEQYFGVADMDKYRRQVKVRGRLSPLLRAGTALAVALAARTWCREAHARRSRCAERHGIGRRKAYNWVVLRAIDRHHVEVAMKYVLLGNLSPEWASKQSERIGKAKAKLDKLGIKVESIHYTQGYYDFVDIVDAPNEQAMLAFSVWYATQGLGRVQSMPAFDAESFEAAVKDATG